MPETGMHHKPQLGPDLWSLLKEAGTDAVSQLASNERPQDLAVALSKHFPKTSGKPSLTLLLQNWQPKFSKNLTWNSAMSCLRAPVTTAWCIFFTMPKPTMPFISSTILMMTVPSTYSRNCRTTYKPN